MSKRVAVVLSGCGVYDGAEIYESVLTLFHLEQANADITVFAPNKPQMHVINHLTGEPMDESRNVMIEAARIVRGDIHELSTAKAENFDALILPGGFGVAKNLSDFAIEGSNMTVDPTLLALAQSFHSQHKPIGLICIAPALAAKICGEGAECTIGNDKDTATAIEQTGARHIECTVQEAHIDTKNKLVTTPAYMLAGKITEADSGIKQLVTKVLELV